MSHPEPRVAPLARTIWLGVVIALSPLAMDMFTPAASSAAQALGMADRALAQSIAFVLVGNAVGYGFGLASTGRLDGRTFAKIGLCGFILASLCASFTTSGEGLILWRFLQGVSVIACRFGAQSLAGDLGGDSEVLTRRHADMALVSALVVVVAPLSGALLVENMGWRAIPLALALVGVLVFVADLTIPAESVTRTRAARASLKTISFEAWRFIAIGALAGGHFAVYVSFLPSLARSAELSVYALGVWLASQGLVVLGVRTIHRLVLAHWKSKAVLCGLTIVQALIFATSAVASFAGQHVLALALMAAGVVLTPAINVNALALAQTAHSASAGQVTGVSGLVGASWGALLGAGATFVVSAQQAPTLLCVIGLGAAALAVAARRS